MDYFGFSVYNSVDNKRKSYLISKFYLLLFLPHSFTVMNKNDEYEHLFPVPDLRGKCSIFHKYNNSNLQVFHRLLLIMKRIVLFSICQVFFFLL